MNQKHYLISIIAASFDGERVEYKELDSYHMKGGFNVHKNEVQRLQEKFDQQCLPRRAYVLDNDGVPVFAGAQLEDEE